MKKLVVILIFPLALVAFGACSDGVPTSPEAESAQSVRSAFPTAHFPSSTPHSTADADPFPEDTPEPLPTPGPLFISYTVRAGDTLGAISIRYNVAIEELMQVNGLTNPHTLQVGQTLKIPAWIERVGPAEKLVPDSEVVYGPAYKGFDVQAVVQKYGGYLASYRERVENETLTGAEIIRLVAERFSVGPRILLALLEFQSGWVTDFPADANRQSYPMGYPDPLRKGLYRQTAWAANQLNAGYYGKLYGQRAFVEFADRQRARFAYGLNPGTAAIQNVLAKTTTWDEWQRMVTRSKGEPDQVGTDRRSVPTMSFLTTYEKLFGDPYRYEVKPLLPKNLAQPSLRLPLEDGKLWYFTGGPHAGWVDGSPWAAVDFAPADQAGSCWPSQYWAVAAAPGIVTASENGRVVLDLDGDGFQGTGWALLYMHIGTEERVQVGQKLETNDPIGHPSCEGGAAETSHVHFARLYNGQWIPVADERLPLILSGWKFSAASEEYDGTMVRDGETRSAENQRLELVNGVIP